MIIIYFGYLSTSNKLPIVYLLVSHFQISLSFCIGIRNYDLYIFISYPPPPHFARLISPLFAILISISFIVFISIISIISKHLLFSKQINGNIHINHRLLLNNCICFYIEHYYMHYKYPFNLP